MNKNKSVSPMSVRDTIEQYISLDGSNYLLLVGCGVLIGYFSPNGTTKALFTLLFMYLVNLGLHSGSALFIPLTNFILNAGRTKLFELHGGELIGFIITVGIMFQILIVNYILHRFTGLYFVDSFVVGFWITLYSSIHIVDYLVSKSESGEKSSNIILGKNVLDDSVQYSHLNIVLSAVAIVTCMLIIKMYPSIIATPEFYLRQAEDAVLTYLWPTMIMKRYDTFVQQVSEI